MDEDFRSLYPNETYREVKISWRSLYIWLQGLENAINRGDELSAHRALSCVRDQADKLAKVALRLAEKHQTMHGAEKETLHPNSAP